jgi:hypothetical protein
MPNMPQMDREHADSDEPQCEAGPQERSGYRRYKGSMARGQMPNERTLCALILIATGSSCKRASLEAHAARSTVRVWWHRLCGKGPAWTPTSKR